MSLPASKKRKTGPPATSEPVITDSRFANIQSDPRYRLPGKKQRIKVDKRFAKALQDEDFSRKARVDRYGRPVETDAEKQRLKRKYEFEESDGKSDTESDEADDDEKVQAELRRITDKRDILREGKDVDSSEDETSSDEESDDEADVIEEVGPGVQGQDVPMGEVSSRLAVVNLDWDNIRAEDLMAVFQSFLPATGRLLKVTIYPSEFGKERIEREEIEGPPKGIFSSTVEDDDAGSEEEEGDEEIKKSIIQPDDGSEFDSTALRQYQLERLRYYYAVLTFSDSKTAKAIYDAVDGTEYLSTANFFDLRFVPDETDFSDDKPREECERLPSSYKPNEFVTDALQHSKVKLTWDADDTTRKAAQARAFRAGRKDIDEDDLKAYLGSDTDSDLGEAEGEDEVSTNNVSKKEAERQRMRALLGLAPEPVKRSGKDKNAAPLGNIQVTFSSGFAGQADGEQSSDQEGTTTKAKKKRSVFENSPEPNETTVEKYVRKEKERKQRRKDKLKANRNGETVEPSTSATQDDDAVSQASSQDQGFNDPFFTEPTHDAASTTKQRKADRLARRAERLAEEAANAKSRAALEKLMADPSPSDPRAGRTVKHFDMTEIEKAEKAVSKNQKKSKKNHSKKSTTDPAAVLADDDFEINAADPRFARLYSNHEFAIDPTNPRFKGTKAMKVLLDEGRKRKEKSSDADADAGDENSAKGIKGDKQKKKKKDRGFRDQGSEVMGLVEKIKKRNK